MRIRTHIELQQSKSKLQMLNKELEKSNATKDKFFSIIAHDLRGPIGNINQYLDIIIDEVSEMEELSITDDLKILKNSAKTSYELLENLLIWASSQKGTIDFDPDISNFYKLVESNIDLFTQSAEKKQISLKNNVNPGLEAFFDYNMINTIVRNLINNAIKYTSNNGEIVVSGIEKDEFLEICVSDNGVGMPQPSADKLFQIDVKKYSKDGTEGEKGSGLGLILCSEFINKHNGRIWAESEVGKGSQFKFTLPKA